MTNRVLMGLVVGTLLVAMLPGVASAAKVTTKADCKNGAWENLVDADGQSFADKAACTGYAKDGGTPTPPKTVFAIAYSNLDGTPGFDAGDVLIAKLVDDNGSGIPDAGDVVVRGQYPTTFTPTDLADFAAFGGVTSFEVEEVTVYPTPFIQVRSVGGWSHAWKNNYESHWYQSSSSGDQQDYALIYDVSGWTIDCACADEINVMRDDFRIIRGDPWRTSDDPYVDVDLSF